MVYGHPRGKAHPGGQVDSSGLCQTWGMKLQLSSLAVLAFLLVGCSGPGPTDGPTPIDAPSMAASESASMAAPASESSEATPSEDESEASSDDSESSTNTSSSKGSESAKPKPKPKPTKKPDTVVSSEQKDTTREGGPIDIAPSAQTNAAGGKTGSSSVISVTKKEGGKGTISLAGKADVYEGTVIARATNTETGKAHTEFTTASCSGGCTGDWSIKFSGLEAGTYKVNVSETDASDGEGKAPYSVDITIKVS